MKNTNELLGKKVKGFKFESRQDLGYNPDMDKYIGEAGTITGYDRRIDCFQVEFGDDFWYYPASEIEQHLVEEDKPVRESKTITPKEIIEYIDSKLIGNVIPIPVEADAIRMIEEYASAKLSQSKQLPTQCPRCKSPEIQSKPITHDCYECGHTWESK